MDKAIVLGSGPSLCVADVDSAMASGWPVIAVNSTWRMAPGCDVIYAGDREWWDEYHAHITSPAARWTCHPGAAARYRLLLHVAQGAYNSGMRAVQFAAAQGAKRIILLGFDCSVEAGTHWHGDHPAGLRNPTPGSPAKWQAHFEALTPLLSTTEIINCSRYSRLTLFRRLPLAAALSLPVREGACQDRY
ncbi:hypothetical protein QOM18_01690 [Serratia marcescens]|uniref:hypothetical protein n=1 Tax=Serratia marcescens TaxID=615 RepID=UPI0024C4796C|nr:hypothetical protein [Serratia marcescens]MDK1707024.1 hypothetical protein [Serratia marcescens]